MTAQFPDLGVTMMSMYIDRLFGEAIVCEIVLGERTVAVQALFPNKLVYSSSYSFPLDEEFDLKRGIKICEDRIKNGITSALQLCKFKPDLIDDVTAPMDAAMGTLRTDIRAAELELRKRLNDAWFLDPEIVRGQHDEVKANLMLAIRHLEDARMRCGKVIQYMGNGESIYGE